MTAPRVSFGIIALNGEPFTRYCLRSLYPFAHEIIVAEGACPGAASIATADGHSTDSTLESIRRFQTEEDPEHKVVLVTAEDEGHSDGFWPGEKDEQSRAYAKRATGDYLWQVDIDEFYRDVDMRKILAMLASEKPPTAVTFKQIQFWGGFEYYVDSWYLRRGGEAFHRLFRWGPGYRYTTHRPPTVVTDQGADVRRQRWLSHRATQQMDVFLYHYSLVFPKQVAEKCGYYAHAEWAKRSRAIAWADEVYGRLKRPFRVHNVYDYPGWLERFSGAHPTQIECMRKDLANGRLAVEMRPTGDIEALLECPWYRRGIALVKAADPVSRWLIEMPFAWLGHCTRAVWHPRRAWRALTRVVRGKPV